MSAVRMLYYSKFDDTEIMGLVPTHDGVESMASFLQLFIVFVLEMPSYT